MDRRVFFVGFFLQCAFGNIFSQSTEASANDSVLSAYYKKCKEVLQQPEVLQMSDTLFDMATQYNDPKMQVVALCTILDHYYYTLAEHKTDSITAWVKRVQGFARQTNQPEYYYFVWSSRLIRNHILLGEYNIAMLEANKMLREAEAEDFKEGIADCYNCMVTIYTAKKMAGKAHEFGMKEIAIDEEYHLERCNISLIYSNAAHYLAGRKEFDQVPALLEKALEKARTTCHQLYARLAYVTCYLEMGNIPAATQALEEARRINEENPTQESYSHYLYAVETQYYFALKQYDEALRMSGVWEDALIKRNETVSISKVWNIRASIYWEMGRKEEAGKLYRQIIGRNEEEQQKHEEVTTAEFATLLGAQKLSTAQSEQHKILRKRRIQNVQALIVSLIVLLLVVFLFLYKQYLLNQKLKRSRDALDSQNRMLIKTREALKEARDMAEQSSRMKTVFIQSMSHEIRTPLNSIVGFSAVLADMFAETNGDVLQYARLIEENSQLLIKMISDILDISALDEMGGNIERSPIDLNACCANCIEAVTPMLAEGVELHFEPARPEAIINGNNEYLTQVLDNLLQNAAKFTPSGSITLAYTFEKDDRELVITVNDTGIGIPPDKQEYIFRRFVKLDEFSQGTGLGLSICRMIAEKLGGTIIIDEKKSAGSCFIFSIPI